jgi:hypothetical protein
MLLLRQFAGRVVAVEIDPLILKIGRELHFERPYAMFHNETLSE